LNISLSPRVVFLAISLCFGGLLWSAQNFFCQTSFFFLMPCCASDSANMDSRSLIPYSKSEHLPWGLVPPVFPSFNTTGNIFPKSLSGPTRSLTTVLPFEPFSLAPKHTMHLWRLLLAHFGAAFFVLFSWSNAFFVHWVGLPSCA